MTAGPLEAGQIEPGDTGRYREGGPAQQEGRPAAQMETG